ncbi:MAG: NAD-dependent epimerase/dehydratase family protein [Flavobacteriaceae bacterium]|nr:NAD-dependent epimerase/dehydratase family protein [Flavobacteriaceae bacterium]
MRVFLTGGTGYIGNRLALSLANSGNEVHALIRDPGSKNLPRHSNIKFFQGDLQNKSAIDSAINGCDKVIHSAAYTNLKCRKLDPFYQTNVIGTEHVCESALNHGVEHLIYTSTLSVFGPALYQVPIVESQPRIESYANDYELTKTMSEERIKSFGDDGLPYTILNLSRVYGPGLATFSNGVNSLIYKFIKGKVLFVPSNLDIEANYVYIDDVLTAHKLVLNKGPQNDRFIIGGENSDYSNLFNKIKSISNSKITILKINYDIVRQFFRLLSGFSRFFGSENSIHPGILDSLFTNRSATSEKAKHILGYQYTPLEIGLNKTVKFLKNDN